MEVKPGYRQTEVGVIPEDWAVPFLRQHLLQDATYGVVKAGAFQRTGVPMLRGGDIKNGSIAEDQPLISAEKSQEYSRTVLKEQDVVIALVGYPGETAVIPERLVGANISRAVGLLRPARSLRPEFLACYLNSSDGRKEFLRPSAGSAQIVVNLGALNRLRLPLPTLAEQRGIAAALSDVDALLGGLDRLIAKKRDLKQAAMQQLLTGQTRLPGFSGAWEVKRLGDVADLNRLNVIPASEPNQPFVHFSLPAFDDGKTAQVELGATIGSNKFRVPANAVLLSKLNPRIPRIWAPKHVPDNACASTEWLVLTPRAGTEREFLFVLCSSPGFCQQMELAATGTTGSHQRISPNTALDIRVAVPIDEKEQTAIAAILSDMDAELAALEARRDKTRDLKQAMMQELLTGKTRLVKPEAAHA